MSSHIAKADKQRTRLRYAIFINLAIGIAVVFACSFSSCAKSSYAEGEVSGGGSGGSVGSVGVGSGGSDSSDGVGSDSSDGSGATSESATYAETIWNSIQAGEGLDASMALAGFQKLTSENAPLWFEDEIASIDMFECAYSNSDCSLFELQLEGEQAEVLKTLSQLLEDKGWVCTESAYDGVLTFNKSSGQCRWVALECTQIDGECQIVLQVMLAQ